MTLNVSPSRLATSSASNGTKPGYGDCWNKIGISGDRSCPELNSFIHCRNCPVFSAAARTFFDRAAPEEYLEDWARWLASSHLHGTRGEESQDATGALRTDGASVLIFRLATEWLAICTQTIVEVTLPRVVHQVPHRSNQVFTGLVNLQGQVQLCFSLHSLLGTSVSVSPTRLIVLRDQEQGETWAFPADEVLGVHFVPRVRCAKSLPH